MRIFMVLTRPFLLDVQAKQVMTNDGLIQPIKVGDLNMYLSTIAFLKSDEAAIWRADVKCKP